MDRKIVMQRGSEELSRRVKGHKPTYLLLTYMSRDGPQYDKSVEVEMIKKESILFKELSKFG